MNDCSTIVVRLHVSADDEADAMKAWEVLQRTALGLGLDGARASVHIERFEHDHEMDEVEQ
jgi:hypothetical protein